VEPAEHLAALRTEAEALVAAAEGAALDAPVPPCPGWTVADLLAHVGRIHRWAAANLGRRPEDGPLPRDAVEPHPEDPTELAAWARAGAAQLVAALAAADPAAPSWTFGPPPTVAFWFRRQAHETVLHRLDAELAAGAPTPIPAALAADGLDEFLGIAATSDRLAAAGLAGTIHLHCTDVAGEWLLRLGPDGVELERVHAKGDVAARGTASDLLGRLRGRTGPEGLEVFGDEALLERFRAATAW
jgi:uncharacterized protein (TIGR03083 family)